MLGCCDHMTQVVIPQGVVVTGGHWSLQSGSLDTRDN